MPLLPSSRSQTSGSRRKKTGVRASSADVNIINPAVTRPGALSVPKEAFEGVLGVGAEELGPVAFEAAERIRKVEKKVQDSADTVDRIAILSERKTELAKARIALADQEGFHRKGGGMEAHGLTQTQRDTEIVAEYEAGGATPQNVDKLRVGLINERTSDTGLLAGLAASAGDAETAKSFGELNTKAGEDIAALPTRNNVIDHLEQLDQRIFDMKDNLNDEQEAEFRRAGGEHYVEMAVDTLINSSVPGSLSRAEAMLQDPALINLLSTAKQRALFNKLQVAAKAKDTFKKKIDGIERVIGPLTLEERKIIAGVSRIPPAKLEKDTAILVAAGIPPDRALGIASGSIKPLPADDFGDVYEFNLLTGERKWVSGPAGPPPGETPVETTETETAQAPKKSAPGRVTRPTKRPTRIPTKETALGQSVFRGAGIVANVKTGFSKTLGQGFPGGLNKETTDANQAIKIFNQGAKKAFSNNPRFPVAEMEIILELLPTSAILKDPDTALRDLEALRVHLEDSMKAKEKELTSRISSDRRKELGDEISTIREISTLMDKPLLPDDIPQGSELIDKLSPKGNPIWKTPEGKFVGSKE